MLVASLEATAFSVIAKHERISPRSSGSSHWRCCSGVPYLWGGCRVESVRVRGWRSEVWLQAAMRLVGSKGPVPARINAPNQHPQRAPCLSVTHRASTSILPVSGALQLNASGAHTLAPIAPQTCA